MKELLRDTNKAMKDELVRANLSNPLFRSDHEGLGVITEEMFEAHEAGGKAQTLFAQMSACIFEDNHDSAVRKAKRLRDRALYAACEYIQVAAMAEKFTISKEEFTQEDADRLVKECCGECETKSTKVRFETPSWIKGTTFTLELEKEDKDA